jgi:hypothetical protein
MIIPKTETCNQTESPRFISDAESYYKTALGGVKRKAVFTNEILYNIISMSIEKYMMGFLTSKNELPPCHTLGNMIKEVMRHVAVSDSLVKKMDYFDKLQFICSFAFIKQEPISDNDIADMIVVLIEVRALVQGHLLNKEMITA